MDQCHNLTCICARSPSSGAIRNRSSGSPEIFTGKIPALLRRSHHEATRLRWRTSPATRIADSVCVMDLLRKFIDGKETAEITAMFATHRAYACCILLRISVVGLSNSSPLPCRVTALIRTVSPHTGIRQHDTPRENRAIRLRWCGQKRH